ncbi:MAG TPA: phosphatase [Bacillota bacterium]|jgi:putative hydrolase|nr:phosphatase [Bacillota bacterium]HOC06727.1 phosphatase [Bacillota bacterium]HPZ22163.1 phosphatase [Bacillota bacterium]HQD20303.1 phosphatase [Bacillota bacterium]
MKLVADLHVHSIASGHAYSTIGENAQAAKAKGLQLIAITDHGPAMPGAPHPLHFGNLRALPPVISGVRVLRGAEVNIVDADGNIDLRGRFLKTLDIVLAGFHQDCIEPGSAEDNTRTLVKAMASGLIDVVVHPGNPVFPINFELVAQAAAQHNVLLELNNVSLGGVIRKGSERNCLALARIIARLGSKVCLGSDAHFSSAVGELAESARLAQQAGLEPDQVVNTSMEAIDRFLRLRGRKGLSL